MIRTPLYYMLSGSFWGGWASLNPHRQLATVSMTPRRKVKEATDFDRGPVYLQRVKMPRGLDPKRFTQALIDTMSGTNCRHEHDCCGCSIRNVTVKRLSKREFSIRTAITFNV